LAYPSLWNFPSGLDPTWNATDLKSSNGSVTFSGNSSSLVSLDIYNKPFRQGLAVETKFTKFNISTNSDGPWSYPLHFGSFVAVAFPQTPSATVGVFCDLSIKSGLINATISLLAPGNSALNKATATKNFLNASLSSNIIGMICSVQLDLSQNYAYSMEIYIFDGAEYYQIIPKTSFYEPTVYEAPYFSGGLFTVNPNLTGPLPVVSEMRLFNPETTRARSYPSLIPENLLSYLGPLNESVWFNPFVINVTPLYNGSSALPNATGVYFITPTVVTVTQTEVSYFENLAVDTASEYSSILVHKLIKD
jgi:hypothetical protein